MRNQAPNVAKFSSASVRAGELRPGHKVLCSQGAGWQSLLVQTFEQPGCVDAFETAASPDHLLVFVLKGEYDIESYAARSWKRASYRPGVGGFTAAGTANRLRWHSQSAAHPQLLRIYIPQVYFAEAMEGTRRAGERDCARVPDSLALFDPVAFSVAKSLASAVSKGAPDLYADAGARFLATHLLGKVGGWSSDDLADRQHRCEITDKRMLRVLEFLEQNFTSSLTIEHMAREAGVSPFHFARLFKARMGVAPHGYVVQLRLNHARFLLAETDLSVAEIALACGYLHHGHFAAAFEHHHRVLPATFRREMRANAGLSAKRG